MKKRSFSWSLDLASLAEYVARQLNALFLDGAPIKPRALDAFLPKTIKRTETCFQEIHKKYFYERGRPVFDHLNSDHYAMFLYLLSNTIYRSEGAGPLPTKLFLLNKALHSLDAYFAVQLPDIFLFVHPVGTVLGNARYKNYFAVYQNCTIGANEKGEYPVFSEGTALFSRASVIGSCHLGPNTVVGANTFLLNTKVSGQTVVVGSYPNLKYFVNTQNVVDRLFR